MKIKFITLVMLFYSCKTTVSDDSFIHVSKFIYCTECELHLKSCSYAKIFFKEKEFTFFDSFLFRDYEHNNIIRVKNNGNLILPVNKKYINNNYSVVINNKHIEQIKFSVTDLINNTGDTIFVKLKLNEHCSSLDCEISESHGVY